MPANRQPLMPFRLHATFAGGWLGTSVFVLFGAPEKWQLLALVVGAVVAFIYAADKEIHG